MIRELETVSAADQDCGHAQIGALTSKCEAWMPYAIAQLFTVDSG